MMQAIEESRRRWERMTEPSPMMQAIEESERRWRSVIARPDLSAMVGARGSLTELAARPAPGAMIAVRAMPRAQRSDAALADAAEARIWWVERLPLSVQLGLLVLALDLLDRISEFVGDLTGEDVPPAYRSATQAAIVLAGVLLALIDARARVADDDGQAAPTPGAPRDAS